jgi:nitrate reductase assembly molybdenum cofactor insertion protein NarJ
MSVTSTPDYVADTLRQALAVADQQADQAARRLTQARREVEHCETALADANARRDALVHELRLRAADPSTGG